MPELAYEVSTGFYNPMPLMPMHPLNHFFLASCLLPLPVGILPLSSLSSVPAALAHPPLAQISEDGKTRADHLLQRGRQQSNAGDYSTAIQTLEQALAAYRAISDRHGEAQTLNSLGVAFDSLSQPVRAVELYQQALSIFRQVQDREGEAKVLHNLGIAFRSLSQSSKAIEHLQQAFSLYRQIGKLDDAADSLMMLGTVHNDLSRYQEAIKFFQQALTMMRGGNDSGSRQSQKKVALILLSVAGAHMGLGDLTRTAEYLQQAQVIGEKLQDPEIARLVRLVQETAQTPQARLAQRHPQKLEADQFSDQATRNFQRSEYQAAIQLFEKALAIYRAIPDRSGEANTLNNLGNAYHALSQFGRAIAYYQQALSIFQEMGDRNGEATAWMHLGVAYSDLSDYDRAIEFYQQALTRYRQPAQSLIEQRPKREGEAKVLTNLGTVYNAIAQYEQAIAHYQQALPIYREVRDPRGEARALNGQGNVYLSLAQIDNAIAHFQQALSIFRQVGDRNGESLALTNLGLSHSMQGQLNTALEFYQQALPIARQVGDRTGEGILLNNLGTVAFQARDFAMAEQHLFAAVTIWESLRPGLTDENKIALFEAKARTYRSLQQVLIAQQKVEAALEVAERGRARAFVELLAQRLGHSASAIQYQDSIQPPTIQQIRQIAKAQNATLVQYSIITSDLKSNGKGVPGELFVWVIQPTGEVAFRQVDLKSLGQQNLTLSDLVVSSREAIGARNRSDIAIALTPERLKHRQEQQSRNLKQLHQLLIQPIAQLLPSDPNARVIFIPQQDLFLVPFPALQDASGTYLIERHTLLTAPSIQVLALTRQQRLQLSSQQPIQNPNTKRQTVLVVGNPVMPRVAPVPGAPKQPLPPLPGAEAEARAIAPLFNAHPLTGRQATKAMIVQQMPQARLIHLATHGLLDDIRGLGSAIALAPSSNDNGLLTAEEILNMKLQAELVVLSACNTGQGRITGDGVVGLSRSFITVGVPSVLVSLWAVPDAPTAGLMTAFYKNLQQHPDKARALRQAMLATMKTHLQPKDWAAFTLIGEAE